MLSFVLEGGRARAERFYDSVELFSRMTHIGDVRSLILHPGSTTHAHLDPERRRNSGVVPGLLRLSIGLEDPADLIGDLRRGFAAIRSDVEFPAVSADVVAAR